jgi:hypothetical protein
LSTNSCGKYMNIHFSSELKLFNFISLNLWSIEFSLFKMKNKMIYKNLFLKMKQQQQL